MEWRGHAAGALEEQCEQCLLQMSSQGRLHLDSVGKVCVVSCFVERRKYHKDIIGYTVIDVIGMPQMPWSYMQGAVSVYSIGGNCVCVEDRMLLQVIISVMVVLIVITIVVIILLLVVLLITVWFHSLIVSYLWFWLSWAAAPSAPLKHFPSLMPSWKR